MTHVLCGRAVGRMRILRKIEVHFKFGLLEGWQLRGTVFLFGVMKISQNERRKPNQTKQNWTWAQIHSLIRGCPYGRTLPILVSVASSAT